MKIRNIFKIISSICFLFLSVNVNARPVFATTLFEYTYQAELDFSDVFASTISIFHTGINRLSVKQRTMVAIGNIEYEIDRPGLSIEKAYVEYYRDFDATLSTAAINFWQISKTDKKLSYSFQTAPIMVPESPTKLPDDSIFYKIVVIGSDRNKSYFPDKNTYQKASIYQTGTQTFGPSGGEYILESGNQIYGNTSLRFDDGALLTDTSFSITELYSFILENRSEIHTATDSLEPVITYYFEPTKFSVTSESKKPVISLFYGDLVKNINNIEVKYFNMENKQWKNVEYTNYTSSRVAIVNLAQTGTDLGYYAIFDKTAYTDNDYRLKYDVYYPGQVLEFEHLNADDSVTIISIGRRKVVKTLKAGSFTWNGRLDNGKYIESGAYIYCIKVNGKHIYGRFVFVK